MKFDKRGRPKKSKVTAVVLACVFGIWSWAYTYKFDAWKFWLNLLLIFVTIGYWGIVAYVWVIIDQAIKPEEFYDKYYSN